MSLRTGLRSKCYVGVYLSKQRLCKTSCTPTCDAQVGGYIHNPTVIHPYARWYTSHVHTADHRPSRMDIQFVDYDNVRFHLSTGEAKTIITLSMGIQCWPDLVKYGARDHLSAEYEGYLVGEGETEPEYDVSLRIDLEKIPSGPGEWSFDGKARCAARQSIRCWLIDFVH